MKKTYMIFLILFSFVAIMNAQIQVNHKSTTLEYIDLNDFSIKQNEELLIESKPNTDNELFVRNFISESKDKNLKSTSEQVYLCDSLYIYDLDEVTLEPVIIGRNLNYYDGDGMDTLTLTFSFDSITHTWINGARVIRSYTNGLMTSLTSMQWDESIMEFVNFWNTTNTYDAEGQLIEIVTKDWNRSSNAWDNSLKREMDFDETGNLIEIIVYLRDESYPDNMRPVSKDIYEYDENNKITTHISFSRDYENSSWYSPVKREFEYNFDHLVIQELRYAWNENDSIWFFIWKNNFLYDESKRLIEDINLIWDLGQNDWVNVDKSIYSYQSEARITEGIHFHWELSLNDWVMQTKFIHETNESDQTINYTTNVWDTTLSAWINHRKENYIYDEQGNKIEYSYHNWDIPSNDWKMDWINTFYYSIHEIIGIEPLIGKSDFFLYPNPAINSLFISGLTHDETVMIHDINGKLVLIANEFSEGIDISQLKVGTYFLSLENGEVLKFQKQ